MKHYEFDEVTGEFKGSYTPQIDPLESKLAGTKVYVEPSRTATKEAPPATTKGQKVFRRAGKWVVVDPEPEAIKTPVFQPGAVKDECRARIQKHLSKEAQSNLAANAIVGNLSQNQIIVYKEALDWLTDMRKKCKELIAAKDFNFNSDSHWPEPSASVKELAKAF